MTSNNLAYAWGGFKEHTVGGYVRATGAGFGVGVVSPRIRPLRQNLLDVSSEAGLLEKGLTAAAGNTMDRIADSVVGTGNYLAVPQDQDLSWEGALKEGFKNSVSGGSGTFSTLGANRIRPADQ
ncbi:hypothetical protein [Rothia sp. CCM 9416]|uniref:hypothetical protein n=1 Tax=Rothia sp. CCM 9416 TaxID=3402655 RepID=UPI003AE2EAB6